MEKATAVYRQALEVCTRQAYPNEHRRTQHNLGSLYMALKRWDLAASALRGALDAGNLLYTAAATPEARQAELKEVKGVPQNAAFALAQVAGEEQSPLQEAVVLLERYRARWLAEAMTLDAERPAMVPESLWQQFTKAADQLRQLQAEAQLPESTPGKRDYLTERDYLTLSALLAKAYEELQGLVAQLRKADPNFMPEPDFATIRDALTAEFNQNGTIAPAVGVYLLTTNLGGLALIIHADVITPVWLELTDTTLTELLNGSTDAPALMSWFGAYQSWLGETDNRSPGCPALENGRCPAHTLAAGHAAHHGCAAPVVPSQLFNAGCEPDSHRSIGAASSACCMDGGCGCAYRTPLRYR